MKWWERLDDKINEEYELKVVLYERYLKHRSSQYLLTYSYWSYLIYTSIFIFPNYCQTSAEVYAILALCLLFWYWISGTSYDSDKFLSLITYLWNLNWWIMRFRSTVGHLTVMRVSLYHRLCHLCRYVYVIISICDMINNLSPPSLVISDKHADSMCGAIWWPPRVVHRALWWQYHELACIMHDLSSNYISLR